LFHGERECTNVLPVFHFTDTEKRRLGSQDTNAYWGSSTVILDGEVFPTVMLPTSIKRHMEQISPTSFGSP